MNLTFHVFDTERGVLSTAPGIVTSYPGGDTAVRELEAVGGGFRPVAWNRCGVIDYAAVGQWVAFHRNRSPDAGAPVLVAPYLPSARGDHDPTDDARVAARLTAATGVAHIVTVDPHSPVWADEARRGGVAVTVVDAVDLVGCGAAHDPGWAGVVAPDKGARDRAGRVACRLGVPLYVAGKQRNPATGKLSGFVAPERLPDRGRLLVIDDICDGGGTFAGLADAIRATKPQLALHLWVSHGCFTGRWRENLAGYASVTSTDSRATPDGVHVQPLEPFIVRTLANLI
ncbi:phosphoribosyltransferase family protein [Mycolicibacterium sp. CBMA 226]|uniref:phosphoribosyltransferase family protein n=1 Tax=Mycolicibacterium sp. CBMA 226 TaxID=2606611 RepID=UPI0012DF0EB2|nr:phosphoribosyltransferase family protein [Mycolicibacterium sp. CBMA 226]MUL74668.1 ribose-phosphate pyrophosphokinase [Mycolicibacterium sp. CBMA 226]